MQSSLPDLSLEGKLDDVTTTPNENPLNDALRALPPLRAPNLYAALVGVWEGVCLRYLIAGEAPTVVGPVLGVCRAVVYGLFRDGAEGGMVWAVVGESVGGGVGEGEREGREGKRRWKHSRSGSRGNGAGTSSARIQVPDSSTPRGGSLTIPFPSMNDTRLLPLIPTNTHHHSPCHSPYPPSPPPQIKINSNSNSNPKTPRTPGTTIYKHPFLSHVFSFPMMMMMMNYKRLLRYSL